MPPEDRGNKPSSSQATKDSFPHPRPPGEPETVTKLREKIEAKLAELLDEYVVEDKGSYVFRFDSALIYVVPAWLKDETSVVKVFAVTNLDVPVTPQLTAFLLARNLEFVLGAFALDESHGAIWFNHNLLGEFTAPEELEATLGAVAQTANKFDDEIKAQFGGRLYSEEPDEKVPPPTTAGYL
jgi:Putative bacterial sensory transduction regulator